MEIVFEVWVIEFVYTVFHLFDFVGGLLRSQFNIKLGRKCRSPTKYSDQKGTPERRELRVPARTQRIKINTNSSRGREHAFPKKRHRGPTRFRNLVAQKKLLKFGGGNRTGKSYIWSHGKRSAYPKKMGWIRLGMYNRIYNVVDLITESILVGNVWSCFFRILFWCANFRGGSSLGAPWIQRPRTALVWYRTASMKGRRESGPETFFWTELPPPNYSLYSGPWPSSWGGLPPPFPWYFFKPKVTHKTHTLTCAHAHTNAQRMNAGGRPATFSAQDCPQQTKFWFIFTRPRILLKKKYVVYLTQKNIKLSLFARCLPWGYINPSHGFCLFWDSTHYRLSVCLGLGGVCMARPGVTSQEPISRPFSSSENPLRPQLMWAR